MSNEQKQEKAQPELQDLPEESVEGAHADDVKGGFGPSGVLAGAQVSGTISTQTSGIQGSGIQGSGIQSAGISGSGGALSK